MQERVGELSIRHRDDERKNRIQHDKICSVRNTTMKWILGMGMVMVMVTTI